MISRHPSPLATESRPRRTCCAGTRRRCARRRKHEKLLKIDVHKLVDDGVWSRRIGQFQLSLDPERHQNSYILTLTVNGIRLPKSFKLSTRPIKGWLRNGGQIPWDKNEVWYVVGSNNRRYRFLYINLATFDIGTRADHNARYSYNLLSDKQRVEYRKIRNIAKPR
jgi:hypothetical protein